MRNPTPIDIILNGLRESFNYDQNEEELLKKHDEEKKNPFTYIRRKSHGELIRELLAKEAKNGTDSER